jgi:predicted SAM-dependent methyltransferase
MDGIEVIYRASFFMASHINDEDKETTFHEMVWKLSNAKKYKNIYLDDTNAGACWNAYLIVECDDLATLQRFRKTVLSYAKRLNIQFE